MVEDADGFLDCKLSISESITAPAINGTLSVRDGRIIAPSYGVIYTDLQAGLSFLPNRISIDSVTMRRDKGRFRLTGNLDYDSSLIAGRIRSSRLDLTTDKFFVARHRDYEFSVKTNETSFTATARHKTRPDTRPAFQIDPRGVMRQLEK